MDEVQATLQHFQDPGQDSVSELAFFAYDIFKLHRVYWDKIPL